MQGPNQPSDATERKLALGFEDLLDLHQFTGDHLYERERVRAQLARDLITQMANLPARRSNHPVPALKATTADDVGLLPSVNFVENRFKAIIAEFRAEWLHRWLACGGTYEEYLGHIEDVRKRVSAEIAFVWRGGPKGLDRWFERACVPAVEKTLRELARVEVSFARGLEATRVEMPIGLPERQAQAENGVQNPETAINPATNVDRFETKEQRTAEIVAYIKHWGCARKDLAEAAGVKYPDLNKWKLSRAVAFSKRGVSKKAARIELEIIRRRT